MQSRPQQLVCETQYTDIEDTIYSQINWQNKYTIFGYNPPNKRKCNGS